MKERTTGCCVPAGARGGIGEIADYLTLAKAPPPAPLDIARSLRAPLKPIPSGVFEMGARQSRFAGDLDSPRRKVKLSAFLMSPTAVTNAEYQRFVRATGYRTVAEQEGWSYVFHLLLPDPDKWPVSPPGLPWWRKVDGACWFSPEGPDTRTATRDKHPVVHIAWFDAIAYCNWAGLHLPSEAQWERAARGGLIRQKFPWGNEMKPGGAFAMNTFQGSFPTTNSGDDGWIGTAPVDAYRPNRYGMFNMTGNVWEWVADRFGPLPKAGQRPELDPSGTAEGEARVQRGGSYLCHDSYCDRYHVHSRTRNEPDSSTGNSGFRVAAQFAPPSE